MAAPNPNELQRINDLLKSIDDLYKKIGTENPFKNFNSRNFTDAATAIGQLEVGLRGAKDLFNSLTDDAQELYGAFKGIVNEIKNSNSSIKDSVKSYNKLGELARQLRDDEKGIHELSGKELKTIQSKLESEVQNLRLAQEMSKLRKQELDLKLRSGTISPKELKERRALGKTIHANNLFLKESNGLLDGLNEKSQKRLEKEKEINKKMGLGGALLSSLSKKLPGPLAEHLKLDEVTKKMEAVAKKGGGGLKVMGAGLKAAGGNMMSGMMSGSNPYLIAGGLLVKIIQFFIDLMFEADKRVTALAKSLNMSKDAARGVYKEAQNIAASIGEYGTKLEGNLILENDILETQSKFNSVLGMSVNLINGFGDGGKKVLYQLTDMVKFLQLSDDELKGIVNLSVVQGKEVESTKNQILGQLKLYKIRSGMQIDERKALKDVLTVNNAIRLSMKGGMDALIRSVAESQKLGKNLNELSRIGESLLNFEQSISSELEAELLLGRDLNLERARGAYFSGDIKSFQEEVNRLVKESGPDFKKNVIAQQALAAALGIGREELADMVAEQEKFEKFQDSQVKLGEKDIEILNEKLKKLGKVNGLEEGIKNSLMSGNIYGKDLERILTQAGFAGEDLTNVLGQLASNSLESTDAQQKFNDSLEKAKDIFRTFVDGEYLDKLATFISDFVDSIAMGKSVFSTLMFGPADKEDLAEFRTKGLQQKIQESKAKGEDTSSLEQNLAKMQAETARNEFMKNIKVVGEDGKFRAATDNEAWYTTEYNASMLATKGSSYSTDSQKVEIQNIINEQMKKYDQQIELLEKIANKETTLNYDSQKASVASTKRESAIG